MRYFKPDEFMCPCCVSFEMNSEFLNMIDNARNYAEIPFYITSGFRCRLHNSDIMGKFNSSHMKGLAADVRAENSTERFKVVAGLILAGFKRIGIGADYIHADIDPFKLAEIMWRY